MKKKKVVKKTIGKTERNAGKKSRNTGEKKKRTTKTKEISTNSQILYLYDIKCKLNDYNRIKRVFYYRFNKLGFGRLTWKSKSALLVPSRMERNADAFFKGFRGCVEVYKVELVSIVRLY